MKSGIFEKLMDNYNVIDHIIFYVYFLGPSDGPNACNFHGEASNFHGAMSNFRGEATGDRGEATGDRGEATGDRGEATNFCGEPSGENGKAPYT